MNKGDAQNVLSRWFVFFLCVIIFVIFLRRIVLSWYLCGSDILGSNLITNLLYFLLLCVAIGAAIFARRQIELTSKSSTLNAILETYRYIYDEKMLKTKGVVKEVLKFDENYFRINLLSTQADFDNRVKMLDAALINLKVRPGPLDGGIRDIDRVISIYNNIYSLIENEFLKGKDLPAAFHTNADSFYRTFADYIELTNKYYYPADKSYARHYRDRKRQPDAKVYWLSHK